MKIVLAFLLIFFANTFYRSTSAEEVRFAFVAPPAKKCGWSLQEECVSTVKDFSSAGVKVAVKLAEKHINLTGPYLNRRKLKIELIQPESCERKAVLDPILGDLFNTTLPPRLAVIGAGCTDSTEAMAEFLQYYSWSQMSYSSSSLTLESQETFPFFFRIIPSDRYLLAAMMAVIVESEWSRVTLLTQDELRFRAFQRELTKELKESNVSIMRNQLVPKDLVRATTEEMFPPDVRIVILNMDPRAGRQVICQAFHRLEWKRKRYAWLTQGWYHDNWWKAEDEVAGEGARVRQLVNCSDKEVLEFVRNQRVIGVSPAFDEVLDTTFGVSSLEFVAEYKESLTSQDDFTRLAYYMYDAVWSLVLALSSSNSISLYQFDPFNITAENRDLGLAIKESLNNLEFTGVSGTVRFSEGSRVTDKVNLLQYQLGSNHPIPTAWVSFHGGHPGSASLLNASCLWGANAGPPPDGTPRTVEQYPLLVLMVIGYFLTVVTIILAGVCIVFTIIFRNRKLIKISSPNLNLIIAVGAIVFLGSVFFFFYPPISNKILTGFCSFRTWSVSIGFSLCFGTINTKMWRVYYIFKNPSPKKKPPKDIHLVLCVAVLLVVDVTILTISTALNATRIEAVVIPNKEKLTGEDSDGVTVNYVVAMCNSKYKSHWLSILFGYKFIMQGVGVFLAFKIRKVDIKVLNDSKEVAAVLYLSSIILTVVLAVTVFLDDYVAVFAASYSFGIIASSLMVLGVVFFSKMVKFYKDPNGETLFAKEAGCTGASGIGVTMENYKIATLHRRARDLEGHVKSLQKTKMEDTSSGQ